MNKEIRELKEKKEKLKIMQQEREKNTKEVKEIEEENKQLDNDFDSIIKSVVNLEQSISDYQKFTEEKEQTKFKVIFAIIFSIIFSAFCTVTTFHALNLLVFLIGTAAISITTGVISSIPYLALKKDFKNVSLDNLKLMLEKEGTEKEINREKYESNNLEIKKLVTRNRVIDSIIAKIVVELLQEEKTYNNIVKSIVEKKRTYEDLKPLIENILVEEKEEEKVKTYSNK